MVLRIRRYVLGAVTSAFPLLFLTLVAGFTPATISRYHTLTDGIMRADVVVIDRKRALMCRDSHMDQGYTFALHGSGTYRVMIGPITARVSVSRRLQDSSWKRWLQKLTCCSTPSM